MKIIVNPHKCEIIKTPVNEREVNITKCEFEFSDEITENFVKEAYFTFEGTTYKQIIINNECDIPSEVLAESGQVELGVVAFKIGIGEELIRYNPSPAYFNTWIGSLKDNAENSEPITPSEMEQYEQALNDGLEELQEAIENIDVDTQYARDAGDYANIKGDYANEQGTRAQNLIDNFSGTIEEIQASIPKKVSDLPNDARYTTDSTENLVNYYKKTETYNKNEIDNKLSSIYKYKGSVATYADLPSTGLTIGDVYNVEEDGSNYAWTGTAWDKLGGNVDLSSYYTKTDTNSLLAGKVDNSALNNYYDKTRTDELLAGKVNSSTYETKIQQIDNTLANKADSSALQNYALKTYVDGLVGNIASVIDSINGEVI